MSPSTLPPANPPSDAFRGLPLSPAQDAEVKAWIASRQAAREPWDTLELDYMLKDFLNPSPPPDEAF